MDEEMSISDTFYQILYSNEHLFEAREQQSYFTTIKDISLEIVRTIKGCVWRRLLSNLQSQCAAKFPEATLFSLFSNRCGHAIMSARLPRLGRCMPRTMRGTRETAVCNKFLGEN